MVRKERYKHEDKKVEEFGKCLRCHETLQLVLVLPVLNSVLCHEGYGLPGTGGEQDEDTNIDLIGVSRYFTKNRKMYLYTSRNEIGSCELTKGI